MSPPISGRNYTQVGQLWFARLRGGATELKRPHYVDCQTSVGQDVARCRNDGGTSSETLIYSGLKSGR